MYLGLPGDGKSMSGVRKVESVLSQGNRYVITNLPLELGELQSYLCRTYGRDFDCMRRVVLLTAEQVRKFWLIRANGWRLLDIPDQKWAQNVFPSLQRVYRWKETSQPVSERMALEEADEQGCLQLCAEGQVEKGDLGELCLSAVYIIDECQNFWPARSYQTTPKGLPFYLTQHRHVGDDCVFITQRESQVEKVVRNLVAEYYVFKNIGARRRLGFRLPGRFGYTCFAESPSAVGSLYQSMGTFRMDVEGLAKCYRTADGVGVGGPTMDADTKHKPTGISWKWAVAGLLLLVGLAAFMPAGIAKLISGFFLGASKSAGNLIATNSVAVVQPTVLLRSNLEPARPSIVYVTNTLVSRPAVVYRSNDLSLAGALKNEFGWTVTLSDGRILMPGDYYAAVESPNGSLSYIELEIRGQRARWLGHAPAAGGRVAQPPGLVPYK